MELSKNNNPKFISLGQIAYALKYGDSKSIDDKIINKPLLQSLYLIVKHL